MSKELGRPKSNYAFTVQKLEPYLKQGLSVKKACYLARIPHSTVYNIMKDNSEFLDQIELFRAYKSTLLSNAVMSRLEDINDRLIQSGRLRDILGNRRLPPAKKDEIKKQLDEVSLKNSDWSFIQWLANNDKSFREEFGTRTELIQDNAAPISSILDQLENGFRTDYQELSKKAQQALDTMA